VLQFGTVGVSGVVVNIAVVWAAVELLVVAEPGVRAAMASALGIVVSVLSNFVLNDAWTWGDRAKGAWLSRLLRYYLVSAAAALLQFGCAMGLHLLVDADLYVAQLVGIVLGTGVNYVANNAWTFRDRG
jgi:dolichol-phosphate mannosyltransferase